MVGDADGFYVTCRLTSDDEPERRVWKMTTRTKPDRGELLYQAPFDLSTAAAAVASRDDGGGGGWATVKVPFGSFNYVRGPRMIPDGPPLNTTAGLYQIGMTMSKFAFGVKQMTEMENFRDGFFELQLKEIGLYKDNNDSKVDGTMDAVATPIVYSKLEAKSKRPLLLKVLLPVANIFFSEER